MLPGPLCVLHIIPVESMIGRKSVDIAGLYGDYILFRQLDWGGASRTMNLDGLIVHPGTTEGGQIGYTQVYRTGAIEAVEHGGHIVREEDHIISSTDISKFYRDSIHEFVGGVVKLGFAGPALIGAALLNVTGYRLGLRQDYFQPTRAEADRANLILPEVWIDNLNSPTSIDDIARPLLDVLWQAFGLTHCYEYDKDGKWTGEQRSW